MQILRGVCCPSFVWYGTSGGKETSGCLEINSCHGCILFRKFWIKLGKGQSFCLLISPRMMKLLGICLLTVLQPTNVGMFSTLLFKNQQLHETFFSMSKEVQFSAPLSGKIIHSSGNATTTAVSSSRLLALL